MRRFLGNIILSLLVCVVYNNVDTLRQMPVRDLLTTGWHWYTTPKPSSPLAATIVDLLSRSDWKQSSEHGDGVKRGTLFIGTNHVAPVVRLNGNDITLLLQNDLIIICMAAEKRNTAIQDEQRNRLEEALCKEIQP